MVPHPTAGLRLVALAVLSFVSTTLSAQVTVLWSSSSTSGTYNWFTGSNWIGGVIPSNLPVSIAQSGTYVVTTSGASSNVNVTSLGLGNSGTQFVLDFTSTGYGLNLGAGSSNWTAGNADVRTSSGISGLSALSSTLNLSSGVELLFSTSTATRYLSNLTVNNSGSLHLTSGALSVSGVTLNNQSGGLIHADGAAITFGSSATLTNNGTLRATGANGKLYLNTNLTTAALGSVDLVSGGHAYLGATLTNTSATLAAPSGGSFELSGGTINGGTVAAGALTYTSASGLLSGVTLFGPFALPANTSVTFTAGTNFDASATTMNLGNSSTLYWKQSGTLSGKTITFGTYALLSLTGGNATLTLGPTNTATGDVSIYNDNTTGNTLNNQGTITHTTGSGTLAANTFNNSGSITASNGSTLEIGSYYNAYATNNNGGTITADGYGTNIYLDGNVVNSGTLTAQNSGALIFRTGYAGNQTTANLGSIQIATGGHVYFQGILDNTNATLAAPTGGKYELNGGTIVGGTLGAGALTFTGTGGTLNGVLIQDNLSLPANTSVTFTGGTNFDPAVSTLSLANYSTISWQQSGTLSGKAITFGTGANLDIYGANNTLTLASSITGSGTVSVYSNGASGTALTNQGTLTNTTGSGTLYANTFTNSGKITANSGSTLEIGSYYNAFSTTNATGGNITADGANTTIYLDGNLANAGTLTAQNSGALVFRTGYAGNQTTANLGSIQIATGGHVYFEGILDNSSATLTAPTGGKYELAGGTIVGGSLGAGALSFTGSGGTLKGVLIQDNLSLAANSGVVFTGGTSFDPAVSTLTFGNYAGLSWQQAGTISNQALTFGTGGYLVVYGANNTLTLASTVTATGDLSLYSNGATGTAITNQGTLTNTTGSGALYANTFSNSGNITANSGSTLEVGSYYNAYSTTNASGGTITADGAGTAVYLDGNIANLGTLTAKNSGSLVFRTGYAGNQTTANLGSIQIATGGHVYLQGTIDNTSATLTAPSGGRFELNGGKIVGGTLGAGALTFTSSGGTLNGVLIQDNLALPPNTTVTFAGGTNFDPAVSTLSLGSYSNISWQQTGTLSGQAITFGNGSYLSVAGANNTLTLAPTVTGTGTVTIYSNGATGTALTNQGTLTNTAGNGALYANTFSNSGNVTANGGSTLEIGSYYNAYSTTNATGGTITADGATVYLDGNIANQGTLQAKNSGSLIFRTGYAGNQTTANLGTVQISTGGHAYLQGMLDNTSATLNAPTGGQFELYGGTIVGGTIADSALGLTSSGGSLNGVSVLGNVSMPANARVTVTGNTTLDPAATSIALGNNAGAFWSQVGSIVGKAVTFGSGSFLEVTGANNSLTLAPTVTGTGDLEVITDGSAGTAVTNQGTLTQNLGSGDLSAPTFSNAGSITATAGSTLSIGSYYNAYSTTNATGGTITADGAGTTIYLNGNLANQGTLLAQNSGALIFRTGYSSPQTSANLGNVQLASGGHAYLAGTLDNTSATLTAPTGGAYELYGGTINSGSIAAGALSFTGSGGTLNGVSILGNLTFPTYTSATLTGNTTFGAAATALTLGTGSTLRWQQGGSLSGETITMGSSSLVELIGANASLTLAPTTTVNGSAQIFADGSTGTALTNQGIINHSSSSGYLSAMSFTNSGTINVTGGTLVLGTSTAGSTVANTATGNLHLNGGAITLANPAANPLVNYGTIDLQNGTFYTNNRLSNAAGGIIKGSGILAGNLILSGGTLSPGNSGIGTLTFSGGALTVAGASTFAVDLGGTSSDQLVFQSPTQAINLGSGLLGISLTLLSAPTANTTFNLMSITSSSYTFNGSFAGLLNSGDTLTANFSGTPYTFAINYQPNLVSLTYNPILVPEPSTYALLGTGVLLLGLGCRRRRLAQRRS